MATDLNKLLKTQAQKQKKQIKKIVSEEKGTQGKRRPQSQTLTGLKNIRGEEEEVRNFFNNVEDENIVEELQRFMNSKAIWKGRRSFFQRFMGLVPEDQYVHFKEHYLNQNLDFKQYFDNVYKPKFIDTDIFNSGKYDEILRELFQKYLTLPLSQYKVYEEDLLRSISLKIPVNTVRRFEDMLDIFNMDIDDKEKFAQLFIENKLPFEDFYLKYMGGDFDVVERREGKDVEEEKKEKPKRKPLMIDEEGNIVEIPGHNLYKFEGPRNRLPIVSREQFRKSIEEGHGIPPQVIELAKIELKTNLNLSNNQIDEIINGLIEKYNKVNKFIVKLGEIILYYVNNFVIKNQENRIANLYRDRIDNNLIKFRKLAYAKKVDFLPELFQFKDADEISVNMVINFIGRQLEIFLDNFKNKLYVYITNITAKAKNIHIGINNVVILSNVTSSDYFMFGYTNNDGENVYFDIRNKPTDLPKKLEKRLSKIYSVRVESVGVSGEEVKKEVEEEEEVIDIEEIYNMFVQSLNEIDFEMSGESESGSESGSESEQGSEQGESELESEQESGSESEQGESELESGSESEQEMKNNIRLDLRKRISDMIREKLSSREIGKVIIDKIIVNNSANIEKTITDMIEEYEDELNVLLNPEKSMILKYLKINIPDIFKSDSDEGEKPKKQKREEREEPKRKKTILDSDTESEQEEEVKPKRKKTSDTESESEQETKYTGSESDSPDRSCKCIKCGSKTDRNLKTKIKDGNEFKTVCFCSFKCFEKYKK